ncbi:MAG: glycine--tRNA ligase [Christensenellaceae bacterium]|jgi:glycyl-tRNA synthetase|nr:glycine--tRNA ligase [Christensenellaceae bacterium]
MSNLTLDKIVALCKSRGFVFPGSEIYGGLANAWDYGPLGVELKNNIKKAWWQKFVRESELNVGVDCAILMNSSVWEASGHVSGFSDPLMSCKDCGARHRADELIEAFVSRKNLDIQITGWDNQQLEKYVLDNKLACPVCGKSNFTGLRTFNLMFKTFQGVNEETANVVYLRPETAQGIFVNFANVVRTSRSRVPFGIAQIGKSFRNEITPGNFIFRTREFEQMELEFFCEPETDLKWYAYWQDFCYKWLIDLGMATENLKLHHHDPAELAHYSKGTVDILFNFPFGWGELWGIADRTDFDLKAHMQKSGKSLEYTDPITQAKYVPYCIEPSLGVDRAALAFLCNAYCEEKLSAGDTRTVLKLHHAIAPYKVAILPLQKKYNEIADNLYRSVCKEFTATYDETGSIGKRYRRQDEIGTPYCVTIDSQTYEDNTVTVRERDSMLQNRISIDGLISYLKEKLSY